MNEELRHIKKRIVWASLLIYLGFAVIIGKLLYINIVKGEELREMSAKRTIERREIPAKRGDIFSSDGKPLATTKPVYAVYFDPVTVAADVFEAEISALSKGLSKISRKRSAAQWENYLREHRGAGHRYVFIERNLNYSEFQQMAQLPIFQRGAFKGGLIVEENHDRIQMATNMDLRTIGYSKPGASAGLEGYYDTYLQGKPGSRLMQKIAVNQWKPLDDPEATEPQDGYDIITTLNTKIQDVAQNSLMRQLQKYEADHGCAIVMEVETGAIVAMANLGRNENNTYSETRNYAVWETTEPGSTFKLLSAMILLETSAADTNTIVDTKNGVFKIYDKRVRDSNGKGYGKISLGKAFEKSSNTGIVKLVQTHFEKNPRRFVDYLFRIGLNKPTGVEIKGEGEPTIVTPGDPKWSGTTLPWMAYGYNVALTPLQLLTVYNAVANNGVMVKPQIVRSIQNHGRTIERREPQILNPAICSQTTVRKLQNMLRAAVSRGTATNIYDPRNEVAGKTGTCQLNYWVSGSRDYQSSFAGYFPADQPKYSCIVVINKPNPDLGYYGNKVAAPVFKDIADEVFSHIPKHSFEVDSDQLAELPAPSTSFSKAKQAVERNFLPNLYGLSVREATVLLERRGVKVEFNGTGTVKRQHPEIGTALNTIQTVKLVLG